MAKYRTHYDNLKITRNAPDALIRAAYKVLMQQYHPDKYDGSEEKALRITKIIKDAYDILIDPARRAEHDEWIDAQESKNNNAGFEKSEKTEQPLYAIDYLHYSEHELYGIAAKELTLGNINKGIMGRAIVEADGNEAKVSTRYIQNRVQQLLEDIEGHYLIELTQLGYRISATNTDSGTRQWHIRTKTQEVHYIHSLEAFKEVIAKLRGHVNERARTERGVFALGDVGLNGGIVFFVDDSGSHGLEAQSTDAENALDWHAAITAAQAYGYGWRLPLKDELNLLFQQKELVGGFSDDFYWSSTHMGEGCAWQQNFGGGGQISYKNNDQCKVRAVRDF
ncbi:DnaJ domain-containing protein [Methylomonas sp. AM2-LC]|uniref:DnaJ domain-containing protein n=1 Tax=Methylomonas sp. AM2-LC TaxID=3153301 RepID=UPI0032659D61